MQELPHQYRVSADTKSSGNVILSSDNVADLPSARRPSLADRGINGRRNLCSSLRSLTASYCRFALLPGRRVSTGTL